MSIKPIKNEHDYEAALKRIEELFDATQNTAEGDELEELITLVSAYELTTILMFQTRLKPSNTLWKPGA